VKCLDYDRSNGIGLVLIRARSSGKLTHFLQLALVRRLVPSALIGGLLALREIMSPNRGSTHPLQIVGAVWETNEIERADIQRNKVVPVFVGTCRRASDDRRDFCGSRLQVPDDVAVGAVWESKTTKVCRHIFSSQAGSHFLHRFGPRDSYRLSF
jgi:hypothetical protein